MVKKTPENILKRKRKMPFDLIIQNNASKEIFLIQGLIDYSETPLSYYFKNFTMPSGAKEGEYTCVLFRNGRDDVQYEFKNEILTSIAHTLEGDVELRYLRPEVFLMKYGNIGNPYLYQKSEKIYAYRKK